tara:strand:- start:659 stop:1060 length:402 start_codon:yes stop_codon:yes gene_type:complete
MTIFQKIIDGEIPCYRIYEDDYVLAFLDIAPLSIGHTLVVPKEPIASLHELSLEGGAALGTALIKISSAIVKATGISSYNILQNNGVIANQAVSHVHFHIIPKPNVEEGLNISWAVKELNNPESLANAIQEAL